MNDHKRQGCNIRVLPCTYELLAKHKALTNQPMTWIIHRAVQAYLATPLEDSLEDKVTRLEAKLMQAELQLTRTRNKVEMLRDNATIRRQK